MSYFPPPERLGSLGGNFPVSPAQRCQFGQSWAWNPGPGDGSGGYLRPWIARPDKVLCLGKFPGPPCCAPPFHARRPGRGCELTPSPTPFRRGCRLLALTAALAAPAARHPPRWRPQVRVRAQVPGRADRRDGRVQPDAQEPAVAVRAGAPVKHGVEAVPARALERAGRGHLRAGAADAPGPVHRRAVGAVDDADARGREAAQVRHAAWLAARQNALRSVLGAD